jgi:hypothetical protein
MATDIPLYGVRVDTSCGGIANWYPTDVQPSAATGLRRDELAETVASMILSDSVKDGAIVTFTAPGRTWRYRVTREGRLYGWRYLGTVKR